MNRTIKEATVKRFHYDSHDQLRQHLADFVAAYNFARRLKSLRGLTPYEAICKAWTDDPSRFTNDPHHQIPGPNTYITGQNLRVDGGSPGRCRAPRRRGIVHRLDPAPVEPGQRRLHRLAADHQAGAISARGTSTKARSRRKRWGSTRRSSETVAPA